MLRVARVRSPTDALPTPSPLPSHAAHNFARFVDNPSGADVVFVVGAKRWYAHRVVLAGSTCSDVFAAMFERSGARMKEAAARRVAVDAVAAAASSRPKKRIRHNSSTVAAVPEDGEAVSHWTTAPMVEIVLEGLDPEIFGYVLRELYGVRQTDIPNEHIVGVLLAANRFLLETLRMSCVRQLVDSMDRDTVMELFSEVVPMVGGGAAAAALEDACACFLIEELSRTAPARPALVLRPPATRSNHLVPAPPAEADADPTIMAAGQAAAWRSWEDLIQAEAQRLASAESDAQVTATWLAMRVEDTLRTTENAQPGCAGRVRLEDMVAGLERAVGRILEARLNSSVQTASG